MPCSAGYTPVTIEVVAAGVIDGKIVTERSCIEPASASRFRLGSLPVWMAGQTIRGEAASITTSSTFTPGRRDALLTGNTRATTCVQHEGESGVIRGEEKRQPRKRLLRRRQLQDEHEHHHAPQQAERQRQSTSGGRSRRVHICDPDEHECAQEQEDDGI